MVLSLSVCVSVCVCVCVWLLGCLVRLLVGAELSNVDLELSGKCLDACAGIIFVTSSCSGRRALSGDSVDRGFVVLAEL